MNYQLTNETWGHWVVVNGGYIGNVVHEDGGWRAYNDDKGYLSGPKETPEDAAEIVVYEHKYN